MLTDSEKLALESYLGKLKEATIERSKLTKQIKRFEDAARSILATTEDEEEIATYQEQLDDIIEPTGFTDAIRKVLQAANGDAMTAMEVKDALPGIGFPLSGYSNPLASVHTILKRLGKVPILYNVDVVTKDGKAAYRWTSPTERMVQDMARRAMEAKENPAQRRIGSGQRIGQRAVGPTSAADSGMRGNDKGKK
jgi:hypothetical protein